MSGGYIQESVTDGGSEAAVPPIMVCLGCSTATEGADRNEWQLHQNDSQVERVPKEYGYERNSDGRLGDTRLGERWGRGGARRRGCLLGRFPRQPPGALGGV